LLDGVLAYRKEAVMDDRLMKMEVKIAYMEETIATLDSVVTEQNTEIANLKNRLSLMEKRFSELIDDSLPAGEKPPHY
jgi:SlyX protein